MMLPLVAQRPGDNWPVTITLTLADGSVIDAAVVWIEHGGDDPAHPRRWTDNPSRLAVRPIHPADDSSVADNGSPWLLAALPADADGPIRMGRQDLDPTWRDPGRSCTGMPLPGPARPALEVVARPDRPDPHSPFEYWRWVLLADRLDLRPPAPEHYGEVGLLLARHFADLWRIGLARLGEQSHDAAATCLNLLTRICTDRASGVTFAAWITDPAQLSSLQAGLLDFRRHEAAVLRDAEAWAESREPLLVWPEAAHGDRVRLAVVNRLSRPVVARLAWQVISDVPIAAEFEPGVLTRIEVERPPLPAARPFDTVRPEEPESQVLELRSELQQETFAFSRRLLKVRPPGVFLPPLRPALTLAEVEARRQMAVRDDRGTLAHVRRLAGRWEVFFECRRPAAGRGAPPNGQLSTLERFTDWPHALGIESVTLLIGPEQDPVVALTVPENGWHRLFAGVNDGTLQIHRRSHADRWYCRIVLPDSWLEVNEDGTMSVLVGFRRAHGDGDAVETAPNANTPWQPAPARAGIDLSAWDELP